MVKSWVEHGPVSVPPPSQVVVVAVVLTLIGISGLGLGFRAAWRQEAAPGVDSAGAQKAADGTVDAKPIVELPAPVEAADNAADANDTSDEDAAKADALAAQTAAAQAVQAKPSKSGANIDEILTSPSEKPPTSAKRPGDEVPGAPVKSDVPF